MSRMEITSTDIGPKDHESAMEGYELSSFYETLEEMLDDEVMRADKLLCTGPRWTSDNQDRGGAGRGIYHDKVGYFEFLPNHPTSSPSQDRDETFSALRKGERQAI